MFYCRDNFYSCIFFKVHVAKHYPPLWMTHARFRSNIRCCFRDCHWIYNCQFSFFNVVQKGSCCMDRNVNQVFCVWFYYKILMFLFLIIIYICYILNIYYLNLYRGNIYLLYNFKLFYKLYIIFFGLSDL